MSGGLQVPGQVGVGVNFFPGENAQPGFASFGASGGVIVNCVGGLTKRQEIAARLLAASISRDFLPTDRSEIDTVVKSALSITDTLLAATEPCSDNEISPIRS